MSSDHGSSEQGLSLADIINIDGEMSTQDGFQPNPQQRINAQATTEAEQSSSPVVVTPSGPSPFAPSKPAEPSSRASFDLGSIWTGTGKDIETENQPEDKGPELMEENAAANENPEEDAMELERVGEDDDSALDAILERGVETDESKTNETSAQQETASPESLPEVWTGQVSNFA